MSLGINNPLNDNRDAFNDYENVYMTLKVNHINLCKFDRFGLQFSSLAISFVAGIMLGIFDALVLLQS